ncbi:GNAT family N-acetyltransferase [Streptomyces sp. HSW2009]|uniref:GNAT family N-acetyltransferase n=1 Tax=Streptomyces sp. HSW2009 TaxID=3142890 RepID=UPI0032EC4884
MNYLVRALKGDEWAALKELRLAALADPVARMAFASTYEKEAPQPDAFWQERAAQGEAGVTQKTFVAEPVGEEPDVPQSLAGMAIVLIEQDQRQTHLVGVYIRPEHRGSGLAQQLFQTALDWSWELPAFPVERVRLWVHEDNARARAFYAGFGFTQTGNTMAYPNQPDQTEYELALRRP